MAAVVTPNVSAVCFCSVAADILHHPRLLVLVVCEAVVDAGVVGTELLDERQALSCVDDAISSRFVGLGRVGFEVAVELFIVVVAVVVLIFVSSAFVPTEWTALGGRQE